MIIFLFVFSLTEIFADMSFMLRFNKKEIKKIKDVVVLIENNLYFTNYGFNVNKIECDIKVYNALSEESNFGYIKIMPIIDNEKYIRLCILILLDNENVVMISNTNIDEKTCIHNKSRQLIFKNVRYVGRHIWTIFLDSIKKKKRPSSLILYENVDSYSLQRKAESLSNLNLERKFYLNSIFLEEKAFNFVYVAGDSFYAKVKECEKVFQNVNNFLSKSAQKVVEELFCKDIEDFANEAMKEDEQEECREENEKNDTMQEIKTFNNNFDEASDSFYNTKNGNFEDQNSIILQNKNSIENTAELNDFNTKVKTQDFDVENNLKIKDSLLDIENSNALIEPDLFSNNCNENQAKDNFNNILEKNDLDVSQLIKDKISLENGCEKNIVEENDETLHDKNELITEKEDSKNDITKEINNDNKPKNLYRRQNESNSGDNFDSKNSRFPYYATVCVCVFLIAFGVAYIKKKGNFKLFFSGKKSING